MDFVACSSSASRVASIALASCSCLRMCSTSVLAEAYTQMAADDHLVSVSLGEGVPALNEQDVSSLKQAKRLISAAQATVVSLVQTLA